MSSRDITNIWKCPVVNANYKKFVALSERLNELQPVDPSLSKSEIISHFEGMPQSKGEDYLAMIESGSFYENDFVQLSERYKFPKEFINDCKSLLEVAACCYFTENSKIYMKEFLKVVEEQITPLAKQADKLKYYTDKLVELGKDVDFMFEGPSVYQLVEETSQKLQKLSQIRGQFRNSWIAETSKVGIKAPLGNPGIKPFITTINTLWTGPMNRTLTQSYDGMNGRKQFLEFLIDCLEPLDPTLPFDTVDNALKKQLANWKKE